jgi:hypothetical protein
MNITSKFKVAGLWVCCFMLLACGNDLSRISDGDLREKVQECDYAIGMNAAKHQVCENYHRECKRRLKSEGRFVC